MDKYVERIKKFKLCCSNCEKHSEIDSDDDDECFGDWIRRNVRCQNRSSGKNGFPFVQASLVCWEWSNKEIEKYFK